MKTLKDLVEAMGDENFLNEFSEDVRKLSEEKKIESKDAFIAVAKEKGYEISSEEMEELANQNAELMSDEELGKVAGGSSPVCLIATIVGFVTATDSYIVSKILDP